MAAGEDLLQVNRATPGDVDKVAAFLGEAWEAAGPDAPGFAGATDEIIAELARPEAILQRIKSHTMLLAWWGDRVVGFAADRRVDAETVELAGLIVLQSMAGRGIGRALVERMVATARAAGHVKMIVHTETDNDRAVGFYGAMGFTTVGSTVEDVEGTHVDVWELRRDL